MEILHKTMKISALNGDGIEELKSLMKSKNSLVSGHSGVGKVAG